MKRDAELLHYILSGNMRGVKRLLAAGAAGDGAPGNPFLPLVEATKWGYLSIVHLFLEKGANIEIATSHDPTTAQESVLYPRGTRAIHAAAYASRVDILRALLQAGAQPNPKDSNGYTPLITAASAKESCAAMVEILLEAGALPSLANNLGRVALHFATLFGAEDAIKVLVAAAPSTLNHADEGGVTPFFVPCCHRGPRECRAFAVVAWGE